MKTSGYRAMTENRCARCEVSFDTWSLYNTHQNTCQKVIRPIRTTDRTKAQIVSDYELWLADRLISPEIKSLTPSRPMAVVPHNEDCRCFDCQRAYLAILEIPKAAETYEIERGYSTCQSV